MKFLPDVPTAFFFQQNPCPKGFPKASLAFYVLKGNKVPRFDHLIKKETIYGTQGNIPLKFERKIPKCSLSQRDFIFHRLRHMLRAQNQ